MVKAIFFDFWGTLVENGIWSPIKQVKESLGIKVHFSEYVVRMEEAMMTRKFASLGEAFESVCREFGLQCNEEKTEELVGMWNKSWMLAKPYDEVKDELDKLKGKYTLVLVSNTDCFSVGNVLDKFALRPFFDKTFFSYDINLIKTDKNFFRKVLAELHLKAEECVLVGDSVQSDVIPAKRLGINAILMDRKGLFDYSPKIRNLSELKTVLENM
ncbi:MAG: HAD family hydrolase [Nanoarchaeota archaeon]